MKVLVLYHYYFPDNVVSAVQYTGLAEELVEKGFAIEVWPANRSCFGNQTFSTKVEKLKDVKVQRIWRPAFDQHRFLGRIFNSIWMQKAWFLRLLFSPSLRPDIILIGTDPLLALLSVPFLKLLRPQAKVIHHCFDLYPEAAVADDIVSEKSPFVKTLKSLMKWAYGKCDLVVNIGQCMGARLREYGVEKQITLTPWALEEPFGPLPFDNQERVELFGDAPLGMLYSGSFGRAHDFVLTLQLARLMSQGTIIT